jgi:hypothetical protein
MRVERLSRTAVIVLAALGLTALSGIALAADDGGNDTVFNFGYDEDSQFFMWNVTSLEYDPSFEELEETLGDDDPEAQADLEALLEACGLAAPEGEEALEYGYTFDGETIELFALTDGSFDPEADEPVDVGECGELSGGYVTGPEGQVNHGMFLRLFNSLYDGPNRGCLVRHIAQSDLGKGEQQIEADPEFEAGETVEPIEDGRVTFETAVTDCLHGPNRGGDDVEEAEGDEEDTDRGGPPQWVLDKRGDDHPANRGGGDGNGNGNGKPEGVGGGRP